MPKYVAIDIGANQVQYLLAEGKGQQIQVLGYGKFGLHELTAKDSLTAGGQTDLEKGNPSENRPRSQPEWVALGNRLAEELAKLGGTGGHALIAVGRTDVDIRRFTLPPATEDELAELVNNQIINEGGVSGEGWVVDYLSQSVEASSECQLEAVVLSAEMLKSYEAMGQAAGLKLRRMVMRPYATASLWEFFQDQASRENRALDTILLVSRIASDVDLIAICGHQVLFWRTLQLDSNLSEEAFADELGSKIARTVAIGPSHLGDSGTIGQIQLLGKNEEYSHLIPALSDQTGLRVDCLDLGNLPEFSGNKLAELSRAAVPLLAMVLAEATNSTPMIDLLNPRKPPTPRNHRRTALLGVVAGIIFCYLVGTWLQATHDELDQSNVTLMAKLKELNAQRKKLLPEVGLEQSLAAWDSSGVVWLDELRDLAMKFPTTEDVTIRGMAISSLRGGSAMIRVTGQAIDPSVIVQMDRDLRDKYRNATSTNFREQGSQGTHPWRFETVITTRRRTAKDYLEMFSHAPSMGSDNWVEPNDQQVLPIGPPKKLMNQEQGTAGGTYE